MKKEDKPFVQTYLLTGIVCLCFLISGLLFVYFMTRQSTKESVSYLQNTAVQSRTALYKQIIGDFQTLDGVAICLEAVSYTHLIRSSFSPVAASTLGMAEMSAWV